MTVRCRTWLLIKELRIKTGYHSLPAGLTVKGIRACEHVDQLDSHQAFEEGVWGKINSAHTGPITQHPHTPRHKGHRGMLVAANGRA